MTRPVNELLDDLQDTLAGQIETACKGDFRKLETLTAKSGNIVAETTAVGGFEHPGLNDRKKRVMDSYRKLELMIAANAEVILKRNQQVSAGIKAIRKYRSG